MPLPEKSLGVGDWDVDELTLYKEAEDPYEYGTRYPERREFYRSAVTYYQVKANWTGTSEDAGSSASPFARTDAEVASLFTSLTEQWREATAVESNVERMVLTPSYQRIIGLGPQVVPLILRDLEETRDHWFWALMAIVGEDKAAGQTSVGAATEAWLAWGRATGIYR
jgi:hypothetical protein